MYAKPSSMLNTKSFIVICGILVSNVSMVRMAEPSVLDPYKGLDKLTKCGQALENRDDNSLPRSIDVNYVLGSLDTMIDDTQQELNRLSKLSDMLALPQDTETFAKSAKAIDEYVDNFRRDVNASTEKEHRTMVNKELEESAKVHNASDGIIQDSSIQENSSCIREEDEVTGHTKWTPQPKPSRWDTYKKPSRIGEVGLERIWRFDACSGDTWCGIAGIAFLPDGNMVLPDVYHYHFKLFDLRGRLVKTVSIFPLQVQSVSHLFNYTVLARVVALDNRQAWAEVNLFDGSSKLFFERPTYKEELRKPCHSAMSDDGSSYGLFSGDRQNLYKFDTNCTKIGRAYTSTGYRSSIHAIAAYHDMVAITIEGRYHRKHQNTIFVFGL